MTAFSRKEVEGFVLIRDGCTMVLDGINKLLEETEPETQLQYDVMKTVTRQTAGKKGAYLKVTEEDNKDNKDYQRLVEDLKTRNQKLTTQGYFCWLFGDNKTVGMKQSKH